MNKTVTVYVCVSPGSISIPLFIPILCDNVVAVGITVSLILLHVFPCTFDVHVPLITNSLFIISLYKSLHMML